MSATPTPLNTQPAEAKGDSQPVIGWGRWRYVVVPVFVLASILVLRDLANRPPRLAGDIWEHWLIAESFDRHGSPELRPEDMETVYTETDRLDIRPHPLTPHAYVAAPDGRMYGVHFWGYAMWGVPAKAYLRWTGKSDLAWPGLSNAMWFLLAIGIVLFASKAPVSERLVLVGLAIAGPGWVYVGWSGSELYSWAFVLIAVAMFRDRRYGWAGLGAGLASLQNPPVILFGGFVVLAALWERRWRAAGGAILGTAVGLLPYAFFQYHFGKPNLIAADFARKEYISWCRSWSQLTDLNQGLLPYAPLLVFAVVYAIVRIAIKRDARALLFLAGTIAVAVGTQVSRNWNSGCNGLQRYLVWLIPMVVGVVMYGTRNRWPLWILTVLAVLTHSALITIYRDTGVLSSGFLGHNTLAKWVLTHSPELYWAEQEIFVERTRHADDWPMTPSPYPVAFIRDDGTVSKMLLDPESVEHVAERFETDPAYLAALRTEAAARSNPTEPFYAHPPYGAVRVKANPSP